ncbi:MAG: hypothetical protein ACYC3K_01520 [Candidatus Nanopelagicales bacterium]
MLVTRDGYRKQHDAFLAVFPMDLLTPRTRGLVSRSWDTATMRSGDDSSLLALHLQVPVDEVAVTLPGPWRKATPWREGLTGAVFTRSAGRLVAIRTVSVPTGSLDFGLDAALDSGAWPEDLEPGLSWVEVGPAVTVKSGSDAIDWSVGQPMVRIDFDFDSRRFLLAIRAAVERTALAADRRED